MDNPTGVIPGDNISNKFWTRAYTSPSNPSDIVGWNSVDFQLAFTGDRCTEIQGLYPKILLCRYHKWCIILGEPLRAKYYGGLEKTSISHDRKYCAVIG